MTAKREDAATATTPPPTPAAGAFGLVGKTLSFWAEAKEMAADIVEKIAPLPKPELMTSMAVAVELSLSAEHFGVDMQLEALAPDFVLAGGVEGVKVTRIDYDRKHRDLATANPWVSEWVLEKFAHLKPRAPVTDPDLVLRCRGAFAADIGAFFKHVRDNVIDSSPSPQLRRSLASRAWRRREFYDLPDAIALDVIAKQSETYGVDLARLTPDPLFFFTYDDAGRRAVEKALAAERAHQTTAANGEPASEALTRVRAREIGLVLSRRAEPITPSFDFAPSSVIQRDGWQRLGFAHPWPFADGPTMIATGHIGARSFWDVAKPDDEFEFTADEVARTSQRLAPRDIVEAFRKPLANMPGAKDAIDRATLIDGTRGSYKLREALKPVRAALERCADAFTLIEPTSSALYLGALVQFAVRGHLVAPLVVAVEIADFAKKLAKKRNVTPEAAAWAADIVELARAGELLLAGGYGCWVAPGSLRKADA